MIVSYWYPPAIGAASERMFSFARYLPRHGWDVRVLTSGRSHAEDQVCHVRDPVKIGESKFADYDPRRREPFWKRWGRDFVWPDRFRYWMRAAVEKGVGLCESFRPDVILASFPPASAAACALSLHEQIGTRLVVDFRDRWRGPGGHSPRWDWSRRRHEELERRVVREAAGLVTVSEAMAEAIAMEQDYPRSRIAVIPNGYDDEFTPDVKTPFQTRLLYLVHVGTVVARNRPEMLMQSLSRLRGESALRDVKFLFVGNLSRDYIGSLGLTEIVETTGLVDIDSARRQMFAAPALLLLVGDYVGRWGHNAKLFEYLRAGRPILCLEETPESHDARLLRRLAGDRSFFARLGDESALVRALERLRDYLEKSPESVRTHPTEFERYQRARLTGELAAFLDRLCEIRSA